MNRRTFLTSSIAASAALSGTVASAPSAARAPVVPSAKGSLPTGKIAGLTVSRLISGGNLMSGWAHARDLRYVAPLMRAYNTEEKVLDTLQMLEERGVNAIIADPVKNVKRIFERYWNERGGKMQWIAEGHPDLDDWKTNIQESIDFGAAAVYVQGVKSDLFLKAGRVEVLGKCVDFIKAQKVPAGIGAHKLEVIMEAEKQKFGAEFYVKTLHRTDYFSARRPNQKEDVVDSKTDNYWELDPERTIAFMRTVSKPWIAFKVLAAGAIKPEVGFRYAFDGGADFICVGMFDFQVEENVALMSKVLPPSAGRQRRWLA
jgi:hypothetical protein